MFLTLVLMVSGVCVSAVEKEKELPQEKENEEADRGGGQTETE